MSPAEWAEVFGAGVAAISGTAMLRDTSLPPQLYGAAAVKRALEAMQTKAAEIAARRQS